VTWPVSPRLAISAASTFIQIPTTLLAQVDSSVGGKTAVNHPLGKNMIGAFYQPRCVVADTDTLATLPDRELSAGLAEVIKYGLIRDLPFLEWLEANLDAPCWRESSGADRSDRAFLSQQRPKLWSPMNGKRGERALLNLGHTFGHAIETGVGYGEWLHGEAVAVGMVWLRICQHGWAGCVRSQVERVRALLARARLPLDPPPALTPDDFLRLMAVDKKVQDGRLRLILLRDLGQGVIVDDVRIPARLRETLDL
jgi:3-dehydroquinate synthase